jgi:transcriptional regulator with XRE-family HTH domain
MYQLDSDKLLYEIANKGLTVKEVAEKAGVGRKTLHEIVHGSKRPRLSTIGKVANAIGKKVQDFNKVTDHAPGN